MIPSVMSKHTPRARPESIKDDLDPDSLEFDDAPIPEELDFESDPAEDRPSKTALKKQAHDLQRLGDALADLPPHQLAGIPMSDRLREGIETLQATRSHEGRRRQRQYVGKLMRHEDVEPLREGLAKLKLGTMQSTLLLHQIEAWRAQLCSPEGDGHLTRFLQTYPQTDAQQLRSLIRACRKEAALAPEQRHGRSWRDLFQMIKAVVTAHPSS